MVKKKINKILNLVEKKNLSDKELALILKGLKGADKNKYKPKRIDFPDNHVKFAAFADAHMGHKCYRPDILNKMLKDAKREGVEFFVNAGDTIEGMSGREGHVYELTHIGASEQLKYFAEQFKKFRKPVYSIEAQDSHGGWFHNKGNMGLNIGEELSRRSKHYDFIGFDEQDIILDNGLKLRLRHPGGGTAYALSYKMQKYVESISGGKKPHMLIQGHFHKALSMFYRNVYCIDGATLCEQTPFMKKIGTPAHLGYWIIDANMRKKGLERVTTTFVPFFE